MSATQLLTPSYYQISNALTVSPHQIDRALTISYHQINRVLAAMEKNFFNPWGYCPVIGNFTGTLRQLLGVAEIVAAIAISTLLIIASIFVQDPAGDPSGKNLLIQYGKFFMDHYGTHGIANVIRGQIEGFIPFTGLIVCLIYDLYFDRLAYAKENDSVRLRNEDRSTLLGTRLPHFDRMNKESP